MHRIPLAVVWTLLVIASGCNQGLPTHSKFDGSIEGSDRRGVAVTTPALLLLATEITGGTIDVFFVGRSDTANANWSPDATTISKLQKAKLIFCNGAGFESWLLNITVPARVLVDTTAQADLELIPEVDSTTHQHGPTGQQSKTVYLPQVWQDPVNLLKQAIVVRDQLIEAYPDHAGAFRAGCENVSRKLDELKEIIQAASRRHPTTSTIDPANSFAYLTRAFHLAPRDSGPGLLQIDLDSNKESELTRLEELGANKVIVLLPVGSTFDALQSHLERHGIAVVRLDTLETVSDDKSYLDRLRENLNRMDRAISNVASE